MGHRLSKIVTRTGDAGPTGLADGSRVAKDSARIQAIGAVDELNSAGVVTKIYTGDASYGTDDRGINRGSVSGQGPDIAWFRDPAGNVLSVIVD